MSLDRPCSIFQFHFLEIGYIFVFCLAFFSPNFQESLQEICATFLIQSNLIEWNDGFLPPYPTGKNLCSTRHSTPPQCNESSRGFNRPLSIISLDSGKPIQLMKMHLSVKYALESIVFPSPLLLLPLLLLLLLPADDFASSFQCLSVCLWKERKKERKKEKKRAMMYAPRLSS